MSPLDLKHYRKEFTDDKNLQDASLDFVDFFEQHNDVCDVCNKGGTLLCCAKCTLAFHMRCTLPKLMEEPPDDWKCAYCLAEMKDGKECQKAVQACREMEQMKMKKHKKKSNDISDYERQRLERIARNNAKLAELGLLINKPEKKKRSISVKRRRSVAPDGPKRRNHSRALRINPLQNRRSLPPPPAIMPPARIRCVSIRY